ncbi:MAG: hypothetical protein P8M70_04560, partial [Verrucomicrobiota bacterium]|nr:hypothetical protein [Verrucomicrobiota bacterium]
RLVHDQPPGVLPDAATLAGMTIDMEEFTSDTSGNAYSAVSAIVDAFYGNTEMIWTDIPSLFHFGVYYDGANAMGGMYKPRHALTFDDAGGLKYLYSTNTIAMEFSPYVLVAAADFTYPYSVSRYNLPPSSSPLANRMAGVFPTRNAGGLPTVFSSIHPLSRFGNPYSSPTAVGSMGTFSRDATGFYGVTTGMMDWAWRGGIDKIRFVPLGYDSLLNMSSYSTNFMWTDTFMTNALIEQQIVSPNGTIGLVPEGAQYFQQMVGRDVVAPDFLFRAELLGNTPDGVSVAFERTGSSLGTLTSVATTITEKLATTPDANSSITGQGGPTGANRYNAWQYNVQNGVTFGNPGPGTIVSNPQAGAPSFELIFNKEYSIGGFEVMWNGESSVVGNQLVPVAQQQWAYIWGPGSSDYHVFPDGSFTKIIENTVLPVAGVPEITLVSDDGGRSAIEPNSLTRTTETLTVLGRNFRSATAMEILNSQSAVVQLIYLDANFIKGDDRIEIPAGIIDYESEGVARQVRIWNTLGSSGLSQEKFSIVTGAPIVFATTYDEVAFDRGESLTISGVGFKSMKVRQTQDGNATLTHIQILDSTGQVIFPDENSTGFGKDVAETSQLEVISDTKAILAADTLTRVVDGVNRSLRVSRGSASTLSAVRNSMFSVISAKPKITRFSWMDLVSGEKTDINTSNPLRRDEAIFIEGEGLNTVTSIELTRENGVSFSVPVLARADAISSDLNGSEVRLAKLAFTSAEADGHGLLRARLRVVNAFGAVVWTAAFNVNVQPNDGSQDSGLQVFINGLPTGESQGVSALLWDRSAATGEDITFLGSGLKAVTRISIIENDGSAINPSPELIINPSGTPGITVSDTIIKVDTSLVQFTDINSADATDMTRYLRFKLESARQPVLTTPEVGQRVLVGVPPKFTSYDLNNTDPANDANFRRDAHEMTVHGEGFQLLQYIDILDDEGFPIIPTSSIPVPTPGIDINATGENFKLLGTVLSANGAILDSAEPYSRRLKIKTPWGIVYSDANASGSFSLTADPVVSGSAAAAFAGGGFTGSNTYDINSSVGLWPNNLLPLVINGQNLMSIGNIAFVNNPGDTVYYSFDVNASTPPSGITFSADGTQISIAGIFIWEKSNGWYNSSGQANRRLKLISGAGQEIYTPYLETNPAGNDTGIAPTQITSIGGSGWSSGHFERNGTLVVTGSGLEGVSHVTLTDSTGAEIAPINPLPVDGINVSANATAVSIGADLFNADANLLDSVVSGSRRVKLYFPDASTLMSDANATAGAFTVSRIPTFGVFGVAYAAVGGADGGAATGIYDRAVGNGNLSITSLGIDMKGVTGIQFWDQGDGAKVATTTDLIASDWTVSADGRSLTLTKATIEAKGANWFSPDNDRQLKLTTVAGSSDTTPAISTQEPVLAATPLSGTGLTGNHFKRNAGTLVVSGQYLSGATQVTLVENNGSDVAGVTPLAVDGVNVVATATTITV